MPADDVVRLDRLAGLPAPVARYLSSVLRDGQPLARRVRLRQEGEFLLRPGAWRPFRATQELVTRPPGFVWDARIRLAPGLHVRVRDALEEGRGIMRARLLGLVTLAHAEGTPEIAAGALHRWLAEAVWAPTALLPGDGLTWSSLDGASARATLTAAGSSVWLDFRFGPDGLVESVFTPERFRDVGGRLAATPWQGRWSGWEERAGRRVPTAGEVEWLPPEGPLLYWRGRVTAYQAEPPG